MEEVKLLKVLVDDMVTVAVIFAIFSAIVVFSRGIIILFVIRVALLPALTICFNEAVKFPSFSSIGRNQISW